MIDYESARPLDEVPEADRIEQEQSAFLADDPDDPAFSDAADYRDDLTSVDREADPADVLEQAILVPLDDEFVEAEEE
ncbi:hypothetical protein [Nocardia asteroides]|uniref:hypothetical protein n=1 Tax=Nocardia asteroides TaxID=1824 RepID=UPI001E4786D6|nr:hypothetical protein [Nocardia asteroides]UGT57984.1 hypothetical protein LTT85_14595 [Nocardia asteroides]